MTLEERINDAVEKAQAAFWAEVSGAFPEIRTGDFCPSAQFRLDEALTQSVQDWVRWNDVDLGVTIANLLDAPDFPEVEELLREAMNNGHYRMHGDTRFDALSYQEHSRLATEREQYEVALLAAVVDEIATRVNYEDPVQSAAVRLAIRAEFTSTPD